MIKEQFKLDNQLCFRLYTASRLITQVYHPLLAQHGLTYPQYLVLLVLWEKDTQPVNDIARRLLLETNTVTPLLQRMEKEGILTRTRGKKDARQMIVSLTREGKELQKTLADVPAAVGSSVLCDSITPETVPDLFRMLTSSVEVETIDDIPLLGLRRSPLDHLGNRLAKRTEDVLGALVGLLLFAPVVAVLALLVKRESPGPAFYGQTRCGYGGRPFTIWKLRSMRADAEAGTGAVFAAEDDPRRTRIGAFMRTHNLDELPQFWNVLKGEMSLVGPRPERPEFVEQFAGEFEHYMRRHVCRPGITGWAQVHGLRGNTSIAERLHADLWYLENWSLALDLKILLRTIFAVRNAY